MLCSSSQLERFLLHVAANYYLPPTLTSSLGTKLSKIVYSIVTNKCHTFCWVQLHRLAALESIDDRWRVGCHGFFLIVLRSASVAAIGKNELCQIHSWPESRWILRLLVCPFLQRNLKFQRTDIARPITTLWYYMVHTI
jgi:hypothetical protein